MQFAIQLLLVMLFDMRKGLKEKAGFQRSLE
jgi:hypothetical protein